MSENKDSTSDKPSERIGRLEQHTISYYRRVSLSLEEECETQEDKELLLQNVFNQLNEEALLVSRNQTVSNIVETLLQSAKPQQLIGFASAFSTDWETAIEDRFASHVCQTLLHCMAPHLNSSSQQQNDGLLDEFMKLYRILDGNVAVFMQHTYASHVLRVLIEVLAGKRVDEAVIKSKLVRRHNQATPKTVLSTSRPEEFTDLLDTLTDKITGLKMLKDHAEHFLANPVLQTALLVTKATNQSHVAHMCRRIMENTAMFTINENQPEKSLPGLMCHDVGSWLVEQLLHVAPDEVYEEILSLPSVQGSDQIQAMALHSIANFVLQTFITETRTKKQFVRVYKGLLAHIESILANNHLGVLQKVAAGCLKHQTKQDKFLQVLMTSFHCAEPVERQVKVVPLVASLQTYEVFYKVKDDSDGSGEESSDEEEDDEASSLPQLREVNLHGSLLLQTLFKFSNPHLLVSSLLDMRPAELKFLACDQRGSFILDAAIVSATVGEKTKQQICARFKSMLTELACHQNGSRVLEKMWTCSSLQHRTSMAEELAKHGHRLQSDRFGRFAWRKFGLNQFSQRPGEWKSIQIGDVKKRQMFENIFTDKAQEPAKKKKKSNETNKIDNQEKSIEANVSADISVKKKKKKKTTDDSVPDDSVPDDSVPDEGTDSKKKHKKAKKTIDSAVLDSTPDSTETHTKTKKKKKKKHLEESS